jgi:hypothetical protein
MTKQLKTACITLSFLASFCIAGVNAFGQNAQECERITREVYEGINERAATQLIPYLSDQFSMAGFSGDIAVDVFRAMIVQLNDKVTDIQKVSESKTEKLTLVFKANWAYSGMEQSTFVFDKNNKLVEMELLPTKVKHSNKQRM